MIIEYIKNHLDSIPKEDRGLALRASESGKCARALGYKVHGFTPLPLNWRAQLVFKIGHHVESDLEEIMAKYGLNSQQQEVELEIGGTKIRGHVDGLFGEYVVDFKSTTTYGFKRAKSGDVGDYDRQMHFYMKALGLRKAMLVYYCKETSDLCEVEVEWSDSIWAEVEKRFLSVITSTKERLPDREYGPGAKGALPWQCSYCAYVKHCWPTYDLSFTPEGKPVLTVPKEPK